VHTTSGPSNSGQLLILEYHQIASDGPAALRPWRLAPEEFEQQMGYLAAIGATVTNVRDWFAGRSPADQRCFAITFDDAFADFATAAWRVLSIHGFCAEVFVPTGHVGGPAEWNARHGTPAPLMSWAQIRRLAHEGVLFGSHGHAHRALHALDPLDRAAELTTSKRRLEDELGQDVPSIAYPYGAYNRPVRKAAQEAGYRFGLTVEPGACDRSTACMQLPRLEVNGERPFSDFKDRVDRYLST
jgi:peptidoglycan/xylan/chitin deacetylase (PgdA/CDA1 family)